MPEKLAAQRLPAAPAAAPKPSHRGRDSFPAAQRISIRYSRFVNAMKLLLPALALILVALVVAWPHLQSGSARFRAAYSDVPTQEAENPNMINARFSGVDGVNRPFTITAETATQVPRETGVVDLDMPQADLSLADGSWLALTSLSGTYNENTNDLELREAVNLFHDAGYEFRTTSAHINLKDETAYGDAPVEGQGPFGHLNAEGFRILDGGRTIIFTGKARLIFRPGTKDELP